MPSASLLFPLTGIGQIGLGAIHTCALTATGGVRSVGETQLWTVGDNTEGTA